MKKKINKKLKRKEPILFPDDEFDGAEDEILAHEDYVFSNDEWANYDFERELQRELSEGDCLEEVAQFEGMGREDELHIEEEKGGLLIKQCFIVESQIEL